MYALSVKNPLKIFRIVGVRERHFQWKDAFRHFFRQRLLHGAHTNVRSRLDERLYLVRLPLLDAVPHGRVGKENFRGDGSAAVGSWNELLRADADEYGGELDANLLLLVRGKDVDDAVDRLRGVLCVERGEDEVSRFGGGDGGGDGFKVAHFADEDDVGVLPERTLEGLGEALGVDAHLPLVDDALFGDINVLDGIFDSDDVLPAGGVDHLKERGERGAFSVSGGTGHQEEPSAVRGNFFERRRQSEFVEGAYAHRNESERQPHSARFEVGVAAEAGIFPRRRSEGKAEIVFVALSEFIHLFGGEQVLQRPLHVFRGERGEIRKRTKLSVDAESRREPFAYMKIACSPNRNFGQKIVYTHEASSPSVMRTSWSTRPRHL